MSTPAAPPRFGRIEPFGIVVAAYLLAGVVALWTGVWMGSASARWTRFVADVAATLVVFVFSVARDNGSTYDAYRSVVAGEPRIAPSTERVLATVLFTDMVSSTRWVPGSPRWPVRARCS